MSSVRGRRCTHVVLPLSLLAALTGLACDGFLGVEGTVYGWVAQNPKAASFALVDSDRPLPAGVVPIQGASVVVEPWRPDERHMHSEHGRGVARTNSDDLGRFETGKVVPPSQFDATITVQAPGFRTLEQVFLHDRLRHRVVIVLIRERQS